VQLDLFEREAYGRSMNKSERIEKLVNFDDIIWHVGELSRIMYRPTNNPSANYAMVISILSHARECGGTWMSYLILQKVPERLMLELVCTDNEKTAVMEVWTTRRYSVQWSIIQSDLDSHNEYYLLKDMQMECVDPVDLLMRVRRIQEELQMEELRDDFQHLQLYAPNARPPEAVPQARPPSQPKPELGTVGDCIGYLEAHPELLLNFGRKDDGALSSLAIYHRASLRDYQTFSLVCTHGVLLMDGSAITTGAELGLKLQALHRAFYSRIPCTVEEFCFFADRLAPPLAALFRRRSVHPLLVFELFALHCAIQFWLSGHQRYALAGSITWETENGEIEERLPASPESTLYAAFTHMLQIREDALREDNARFRGHILQTLTRNSVMAMHFTPTALHEPPGIRSTHYQLPPISVSMHPSPLANGFEILCTYAVRKGEQIVPFEETTAVPDLTTALGKAFELFEVNTGKNLSTLGDALDFVDEILMRHSMTLQGDSIVYDQDRLATLTYDERTRLFTLESGGLPVHFIHPQAMEKELAAFVSNHQAATLLHHPTEVLQREDENPRFRLDTIQEEAEYPYE
jgi:hypothetical protein